MRVNPCAIHLSATIMSSLVPRPHPAESWAGPGNETNYEYC